MTNRCKKRASNPQIKSRRGRRRGKTTEISPYTLERAKKSKTPFVTFYGRGYGAEDPIFIVNPLDVEGRSNKVTIWQFSHGGIDTPTMLAVLNKSEDDGLEEAAGWLADNASGYFMDEEYLKERYDDALKELVDDGADPEDEETIEQAQQEADEGLIYTESGWLDSSAVAAIWPKQVEPELKTKIVNKALDRYRKEYDEEPYGSESRRSSNPLQKIINNAVRFARGK